MEEAYLIDEIVDIPRGSVALRPAADHPGPRRRGWLDNHNRVERLIAENHIVGHRLHRRRSLTKPDDAAPPLPDLVGRLFDPRRAGSHLLSGVQEVVFGLSEVHELARLVIQVGHYAPHKTADQQPD